MNHQRAVDSNQGNSNGRLDQNGDSGNCSKCLHCVHVVKVSATESGDEAHEVCEEEEVMHDSCI